MQKASTAQTTAMIPPQANDDLMVARPIPTERKRQVFTKANNEQECDGAYPIQ
jgi:hypothetical protein